MVFPRFPRETTGTEVSSGRGRLVLGGMAAGPGDRIPFGHGMRDRLLVEGTQEGGVLPPEETGHLPFLGFGSFLEKMMTVNFGKESGNQEKGFPLSREEAFVGSRNCDCARILARVSLVGGAEGGREREGGKEEKSPNI